MAAAPIKVTKAYVAVGVAPHGSTQRWTYTVPAGRYAVVEELNGVVHRDAVAGALGQAILLITITPSGVAAMQSLIGVLQLNTLGAQVQTHLGAHILMHAGDVIACTTQDGSTGGSHLLDANMIASEFDA